MTPDNIMAYRDALGGRRFIMSMGAGLVFTLLFAAGRMTEPVYQLLEMATIGAYLSQSLTERIKGKSETELGTPTPKVE